MMMMRMTNRMIGVALLFSLYLGLTEASSEWYEPVSGEGYRVFPWRPFYKHVDLTDMKALKNVINSVEGKARVKYSMEHPEDSANILDGEARKGQVKFWEALVREAKRENRKSYSTHPWFSGDGSLSEGFVSIERQVMEEFDFLLGSVRKERLRSNKTLTETENQLSGGRKRGKPTDKPVQNKGANKTKDYRAMQR